MTSRRKVHRIALLGAECTGKTSLAIELARHLPALWLPEVLREFCEQRGRTPRAHEQRALLEAQLARETEGAQRALGQGLQWLVSDSTPLATALYSAELFDDFTLMGEAIEHQRRYTLTLVTAPDLPWVQDGIQRDGAQAREAFHARLLQTLGEHALEHLCVEGDPARRLAVALQAAARAYNSDQR